MVDVTGCEARVYAVHEERRPAAAMRSAEMSKVNEQVSSVLVENACREVIVIRRVGEQK
jgi:hypothetical protein